MREPTYERLNYGRPVEDHGKDRHSQHPKCGTLLSRYNPSATCSAHQGWQDTRTRNYG